MSAHDDQLETVARIMEDTRIAVLTYVGPGGALVSTPMGTQDFEHPGTTAIQMAKGLVSDDRPDLGDNDTVAL